MKLQVLYSAVIILTLKLVIIVYNCILLYNTYKQNAAYLPDTKTTSKRDEDGYLIVFSYSMLKAFETSKTLVFVIYKHITVFKTAAYLLHQN